MNFKKIGIGIFIITLILAFTGLIDSVYEKKDDIKSAAEKPIVVMPQNQFNMEIDKLMMVIIRDIQAICNYDNSITKNMTVKNPVEEKEKIEKARKDIDFFYKTIGNMTLNKNQEEKINGIMITLGKLKVDLLDYEKAIDKKQKVDKIYASMKNNLITLQKYYSVGEELR